MSSNAWQNIGTEKIQLTTYFNSKFSLTFGDVADLANYIISPPVLPSLFQSPNDWLTSLTYFPFDVSYGSGFSRSKLMIGIDKTDIGCTEINEALTWYNLGEFYIDRNFNNFADYTGYTKIQVWLPFLGFVDVNPNDVLGKYLEFALSVDVNTGQSVYYIGVSDTSITPLETLPKFAGSLFENTRILSTHSCQLGVQIPIGATNSANTYRNIVMGAVKAIGVATGAYAAGAMGAGVTTSKTTTVTNTKGSFTRSSPKTGRMLKQPGTWDKQNVLTSDRVVDKTPYLKGKAVSEIFNSSSQALASMSVGATTDNVNNPALLFNGSNSIKVVIYTPKMQPTDDDYNHIYGKPLGQIKTLSTLTGYTEIGDVHLNGAEFGSATQKELSMLQDALLSGIIL